MEGSIEQEVIGLHVFLELWLSGTCRDDDETFVRVERAMAPELQYVTPRGVCLSRDALLQGLRSGYGAKAGGEPPFLVEIRELRTRVLGEGLGLAVYEEWQQLPSGWSARLSTALFRSDPQTPGGLNWTHLHECWLPDRAEI